MRCHNCANTDCFVLVLELAVLARGPADFVHPDWSLLLQCPACASTDVEGDPATLLSARIR